jgi:hypothetical protein
LEDYIGSDVQHEVFVALEYVGEVLLASSSPDGSDFENYITQGTAQSSSVVQVTRVIVIGIGGASVAGKSTLAIHLVKAFGSHFEVAPQDNFVSVKHGVNTMPNTGHRIWIPPTRRKSAPVSMIAWQLWGTAISTGSIGLIGCRTSATLIYLRKTNVSRMGGSRNATKRETIGPLKQDTCRTDMGAVFEGIWGVAKVSNESLENEPIFVLILGQ